MKALITEVEILDETHDIIAKFKAFDEESFTIELLQDIWSSDDLRKLASVLESKWLYCELEIQK